MASLEFNRIVTPTLAKRLGEAMCYICAVNMVPKVCMLYCTDEI